MMRILAAIAAAIVIAVLGWFAGRSYQRSGQPPTAAPTATALLTPTPAVPLPTPSPPHHRLAGTVVGDVRYAVIEDPSGRNDLYRPGQTIPDLGVLVEVGPRSAVIEHEGTRFELQLAAAPTPTLAPTPEETEEELTEPTPDSDLDQESDSSDSESSSLGEPDRPAS